MANKLAFELDWERLDSDSAEERATFAAIGIRCDDIWLTEAEDAFVNRVRQKVHLSGYLLAEWIAWNWWRLRWEPRRQSDDWYLAHKLSTIGGGYVWPNITVVSDGERVVLAPQPTASQPSVPLRYMCHTPVAVPAAEFEAAVDLLFQQVNGQLVEHGIQESNFQQIWKELCAEREDPEIARRRVFQALLGRDPDEIDEQDIDLFVKDAAELSESGVQELVAGGIIEHAPAIKKIAERLGFDSRPREAVRLHDKSRNALPTNVAAWRRGVAAARALREQERLGAGPISNAHLCQLAAVEKTAIDGHDKGDFISFALDRGPTAGSVVLRSRFETGRRFDLARLLGDRVAALTNGALKPATRSQTYRQKLQRAFAGEFLCPFEALADRLRGDFSEEAVQEAAVDYNVSPLTVQTLLANHNLIERESLLDALETRP